MRGGYTIEPGCVEQPGSFIVYFKALSIFTFPTSSVPVFEKSLVAPRILEIARDAMFRVSFLHSVLMFGFPLFPVNPIQIVISYFCN